MATRSYPRLDIVTFGRELVQSGDLDPIYLALNRVRWPEAQRLRWLVAYCAYYHAGAACFLSEFQGAAFWSWMHAAALNEDPTPHGSRWPRGHERRHFRGQQATLGVQDWEGRYPDLPEQMFLYIRSVEPPSTAEFLDVRRRALEHRSVGTWLSFKMTDLVDACLGVRVDQSDLMNFMYEAPVKSLVREWQERLRLPLASRPRNLERTIAEMNAWLREQLAGLDIPHRPGEPLDNFCLETVWCKHQSHLNGHYPLRNDIDEIRGGLEPWTHSAAAREFLEALP